MKKALQAVGESAKNPDDDDSSPESKHPAPNDKKGWFRKAKVASAPEVTVVHPDTGRPDTSSATRKSKVSETDAEKMILNSINKQVDKQPVPLVKTNPQASASAPPANALPSAGVLTPNNQQLKQIPQPIPQPTKQVPEANKIFSEVLQTLVNGIQNSPKHKIEANMDFFQEGIQYLVDIMDNHEFNGFDFFMESGYTRQGIPAIFYEVFMWWKEQGNEIELEGKGPLKVVMYLEDDDIRENAIVRNYNGVRYFYIPELGGWMDEGQLIVTFANAGPLGESNIFGRQGRLPRIPKLFREDICTRLQGIEASNTHGSKDTSYGGYPCMMWVVSELKNLFTSTFGIPIPTCDGKALNKNQLCALLAIYGLFENSPLSMSFPHDFRMYGDNPFVSGLLENFNRNFPGMDGNLIWTNGWDFDDDDCEFYRDDDYIIPRYGMPYGMPY